MLFTRMTSHRDSVVREGFNFISLKTDGSTLVVVGRVFITKNALPDLAMLSPIGRVLLTGTGEGRFYEGTQTEFKETQTPAFFQDIKEAD